MFRRWIREQMYESKERAIKYILSVPGAEPNLIAHREAMHYVCLASLFILPWYQRLFYVPMYRLTGMIPSRFLPEEAHAISLVKEVERAEP